MVEKGVARITPPYTTVLLIELYHSNTACRTKTTASSGAWYADITHLPINPLSQPQQEGGARFADQQSNDDTQATNRRNTHTRARTHGEVEGARDRKKKKNDIQKEANTREATHLGCRDVCFVVAAHAHRVVLERRRPDVRQNTTSNIGVGRKRNTTTTTPITLYKYHTPEYFWVQFEDMCAVSDEHRRVTGQSPKHPNPHGKKRRAS